MEESKKLLYPGFAFQRQSRYLAMLIVHLLASTVTQILTMLDDIRPHRTRPATKLKNVTVLASVSLESKTIFSSEPFYEVVQSGKGG